MALPWTQTLIDQRISARIVTPSSKPASSIADNGPEDAIPRLPMRAAFTVLLVPLLLATFDSSRAAEVRLQNQSFVIEGEIETGDYDKLEALVSSKGWYVHSVTIGSRGGDILESLKIGRLIRKMRFATIAPVSQEGEDHHPILDPSNATCASACFYVFIAGVHRVGGALGLHRPTPTEEYLRAVQIDEAIEEYKRFREKITNYIAEMGVPTVYADRIFSIPSDQIEYLEEEEVRKHFSHEIPEVDDWLSARCPRLTSLEAMAWYDKPWQGREPSDAEEEIIAQANDKFMAMENCKLNERKRMSCRAWVRVYGVGNRAGYQCSQYDRN